MLLINVILTNGGTKEIPRTPSRIILNEMLSLKSLFGKTLLPAKTYILKIIKRTGNGKTTLSVNKVNKHLHCT